MGKFMLHLGINSLTSHSDIDISGGRDEAIAPEPPSLMEISNDGPGIESPIFRLPTELILHIFKQCGPGTRHRIRISHTCRRWRQIAVNDASLWTKIHIQTGFRTEDTRSDNFLSFLSMQLDRTADRLLDVTWIAGMSDELFVGTLHLIREKAPFSRWRTLRVKLLGDLHIDAPWSTFDAFANLESLLVWKGTDDTIIGVIDATITSRLDVLDLRTWPEGWRTNIMTSFPRSFTHISSLLLVSYPSTLGTPSLPANVAKLQLDRQRQQHLFPHVQTYELGECTFSRRNSIDLRSMTTLIVKDNLTITCQVLLPALRELKIGTLWIDTHEKIEAPALDILCFTDVRTLGVETNTIPLRRTDGSLLEPGYLLSPNVSISSDSHLLPVTLITLLAKSPKVTHATLRFDHWYFAKRMLEELLKLKTATDSPSAENKILCPRLSELRLEFDWEFSGWLESRKWLIDTLKARKEAGLTTPRSIYVSWKGEGTYILLTG